MTVDDIPNQGEPIYQVTDVRRGIEICAGRPVETHSFKMEIVGYKHVPLPWVPKHAD